MTVFQSLEENFAFVGITEKQSRQKNPFNLRILMSSITFVVSLVFNFVFLFYIANDFEEYIESFYISTTMLGNSIVFANYVWKMPNLFKCFEGFRNIIGKSELAKYC